MVSLMAAKPAELEGPSAVEDFYVETFEFPAGFMTQYPPSPLIGGPVHQALATGFPSANVSGRARRARQRRHYDAPGHLARPTAAGGSTSSPVRRARRGFAVSDLADWLEPAPDSPVLLTRLPARISMRGSTPR